MPKPVTVMAVLRTIPLICLNCQSVRYLVV
jgi:hypothetical protein